MPEKPQPSRCRKLSGAPPAAAAGVSATEQLRAQLASVTAYDTPSRSVTDAPAACQPSVTVEPASAPTAMSAGGSEHTAPAASGYAGLGSASQGRMAIPTAVQASGESAAPSALPTPPSPAPAVAAAGKAERGASTNVMAAATPRPTPGAKSTD